MFVHQPARDPVLESFPLFFSWCVHAGEGTTGRDILSTGTIPVPAATDALLLAVWPKQRVWGAPDPPDSSLQNPGPI